MKIKTILPEILLTILLISILIIWPILFIVFNSQIWYLIQRRNGVDIENLQSYDNAISSFVRGYNEKLDFLTQEESYHLQDVRQLVITASSIFLFSIVLFVMVYFYLKPVKQTLRKVSIGVISFLVILMVLSLLSFQWVFLKFHEIFFVDNYAFLSNSMLKTLYPDSFFRDIFIIYFTLAIASCLAVILASYRLKI